MGNAFYEYDHALASIVYGGRRKSNKRTGVPTRMRFAIQTRYSLEGDSFPIMTRRKYWPKSIFAELLWFISGSTNNKDLQALGANIWTPWVSKEFEEKHGYCEGSFGPIYGFQLRHFGGYYGDGGEYERVPMYSVQQREFGGEERVCSGYRNGRKYGTGGFDQLQYMIDLLKSDPSDRRILFSLWNPCDLHKQRLPPCHYTYQAVADDDGRLYGHLTQRSNDYPIGVPANVQFYSALTVMLAQQVGLRAAEFVHEAVDAHVYENQIPAVKEYLALPEIPSPKLTIRKAKDIFSYTLDDFVLENYQCGPKIDIPVAV
jgi:thymidylate synthase